MNQNISRMVYTTVQKLRGWDYHEALSELERSQYEPLEKVRENRFILLQKLLTHCSNNVPYYRESWKKIGFSPSHMKSEEDIGSLPIITKEILRENYDNFISTAGDNYEVWKSSGSTGKPFPFCLDKNTIKYNTFASLTRGKRWWGVEYGTPEGMIWSGISDVSGTLKGKFEAVKRKISWGFKNIRLLDVYDINEQSAQYGYDLFLRHKPTILRCITSGLFRFCVEIDRLGLDGRRLGIKGAIYTGEGLPLQQKKFIEDILGCKTICEYGCTELGAIGFECPEGSIHLSHENYILEFVNDGVPAKPGEKAELIVTNLRNFAAPFVRYSVGDYVTPSNRLCSCGRTLPIIDNIDGRLHDTIMTPDGTVIHGLFFTHLFDEYDQVHQFRVVQDDLNSLNIELVGKSPIDTQVISNIQNVTSNKFGKDVMVQVYQVKELPISQRGKTPWIISHVNRDA